MSKALPSMSFAGAATRVGQDCHNRIACWALSVLCLYPITVDESRTFECEFKRRYRSSIAVY